MAKQTFTALQILTAAQQNALQANDYNQTVSTKTASYTLVAADVGTKIVMNSASATTITVNTSLFSAGDTLTILNIGAGVTTVTAGTATVSTSGTLALVTNAGGTLYFTSAGVSVFQANAAASGLTLVSATTIGSAVASVTISNAFSTTYDAYKVVISGGAGSTSLQLNLTFGSTVTGYSYGLIYNNYSSTVAATGGTNAASIAVAGIANANGISFNADVISPFLAKETIVATQVFYDSGNIGATRGYLANTTSYTAFTLTTSTGTLTGGTVRVYGYQNS